MEKKEDLLFSDDILPVEKELGERWKILVVDDEEDVHVMTKLALEDFSFQNRKINLISAYTGEEAKKLINMHPDTALILLDVVMEEEDSGLKFVKYLREEVKNPLVRIILRTGQPGYAPERSVIINYDINDYKEKTELTATKFFTSVVMALRTYSDLEKLEHDKKAIQDQATAAERFVPRNFLKLLDRESIVHVQLGDNVEQEMAILFLDIRSFTTIADHMTPKQAFEFINNCLSYFEPVIIRNEGFIDKYIGDAIMALFTNADAAVNAAVNLLEVQDKYNAKNPNRPIQIGIGINAGLVMVGSVGFHDRLECTVISDVVNVAARLEKLNVNYGTRLLISENVLKRMKNPDRYKMRNLGKVLMKGKADPTTVYEVLDADPKTEAEFKWQTKADFEEGLSLFQAGKLEEAKDHFTNVLETNPSDQVAKFYINECTKKP